jgi:hypothetical protein
VRQQLRRHDRDTYGDGNDPYDDGKKRRQSTDERSTHAIPKRSFPDGGIA